MTNAPLADLAASRLLAATQDRDRYRERLMAGLDQVQPDRFALVVFWDATYHAFALEAWNTVAKRDLDRVCMVLYDWTHDSTTHGNTVARMVSDIKALVARDVVKDLTLGDYLTEQHLRVLAAGTRALR